MVPTFTLSFFVSPSAPVPSSIIDTGVLYALLSLSGYARTTVSLS